MRKLGIFGIVVACLYYYVTWKPSTESIVNNMEFGDHITYNGQAYHSSWTKNTESIEGYIRRIDRHYDKNIPIITYNLVITTGDYNDPDIVDVRHKGGGNYRWSSKTNPSGSIIFYHTVPINSYAQSKLDGLAEGDTVEILARISKNSEIRSDSGAFVKLMHINHKIILVEDIK